MPSHELELVETFRFARRPQKRARQLFEKINILQDIARDEGVGMKAHAGMTALDTVTAHEVAALQARYDRLTKRPAEDAMNAIKRTRATTIDSFMNFAFEGEEVVIFEEEGDFAFGIPLDKNSQNIVNAEREVLAACLSAAAGSAIDLEVPDDGHYLTVAITRAGQASDDVYDFLAEEAERILWTPGADGTDPIGLDVDMYDVEAYDSKALIYK